MSKRLIFSFVLSCIAFSAYGMRQEVVHPDDGPGNISDELLEDISIREEVAFEEGRLSKKRLFDVDEQISQQIMRTQGAKLIDLIDDLKDFHKDPYPPRGKIFVGTPGCGKSTIAKYIPQKYGYNCYFVKSSTIADRFKASGSQNLKLLFDSILDDQSPCVLIMDEINALTDKSGKNNDSDSDMATTLWSYLDDFKRNKNILWIATTNSCDDIPEQVLGRVRTFRFKDPSFSERKDIIKFHLGEYNGLSSSGLSLLALCWEGKQIRHMVDNLHEVVNKKNKKNPDETFVITFDDIRRHGLDLEWPRCKKIKSTIVKHPNATIFVAGCGFGLAMYYLQHRHALAMHQANLDSSQNIADVAHEQAADTAAASLKQSAEQADKSLAQSLKFHNETLAQSRKFHYEDRLDRRIDSLISLTGKWLNADTAGKMVFFDSVIALKFLQTVPDVIEQMGGDQDAADFMRDSFSYQYAGVYLVLQNGLPWIIGGPVAPAVLYGLMGLYVVGKHCITK